MMEMWGYIAGVLGGIVLLGNVGVVIGRWIRPAMNVKKEQEKQSERLDLLEAHERADLERLEQLEKMSKLQCKSFISLLNHMIDGNGVENMKKTREEIQELLTNM